MDERKRLVGLLCAVECKGEEDRGDCPERRHGQCRSVQKLEMCQIGAIADFLLSNGVLVLPCHIGDALYFPMRRQVIPYRVTMIRVREEGVKITCTNDEAMLQMTIDEDHIGKTIFKTYEEAEKAAGIWRAET